jgi:exonuclease SbcD
MIKFIHTADIHFGMENYGKIDPATGIHTRLLDFEKALHFCIDRAIKEDVDFFLFSGDAYKTAHPTPTHQRLLMHCFLRLFRAHIPLVMVIGNHDNPLSFGKAHALEIFGQLPVDGFHVIDQPTTLMLQTKGGPVQIVGIPWPSRSTVALNADHTHKNVHELAAHISEKVSEHIALRAEQLDQAIPALLAAHLTVDAGIFSGSEKRAICGTDPLFSPAQLAIEPFDYVALGHLHRYQNLHPHGYPAVVYSGSIERVDFGERKEEKGFCLVSIPAKGKAEHQFIKGPSRPFVQIEVHIDPTRSHTDQIIHEIKKQDLSNAVVKIVYHVPPHAQDRVDSAAIQNACAHVHYLVGIFPVRQLEVRQQRAQARLDMNLETLLKTYIATKPDLQHQQETLIKKALELEQAVQQAREE